MKILYISNWGINDGLVVSTVIPHIKILSSFECITQITLCTIERERGYSQAHDLDIEKVIVQPIAATSFMFTAIRELFSVAQDFQPNLIVARSAPAGILALALNLRFGIRFVVESFEPHSQYMLENKVWSRFGPKFWAQYIGEVLTRRFANKIIVVSHKYQNQLRKTYGDQKVLCAPCAVDPEKFSFSNSQRLKVRKELKISESHIVAIYVGKFGGIYWSIEQSGRLFGSLLNEYQNFHLIILSADDQLEVKGNLLNNGFSEDQFTVLSAKHEAVPKYLSAADIGICLHRNIRSSAGYSPVKIGEYYANGLPVLVENNIGDDSGIIANEKAGALIEETVEGMKYNLSHLNQIIQDPKQRIRISNLAKKYRSFAVNEHVYKAILDHN